MSLQVGNAFQVIIGKDGLPLDGGFVYIGEPEQNAEVYPIQIFYDEDLTIPAPQPLRTINGYFSRNGSAAKIFCGMASCSIIVRDKNNVLQWLDLGYAGILNQEIQDEVKRGIANKYDPALTYQTGNIVLLDDGTEVISTAPNNTSDPDVNMTGWELKVKSSQILTDQGITQEELNALKADTSYVDAENTLQNEVIAQKADTTYVDTAISNLSTEASKFYPTLAEANADIANIAVNQVVNIGEAVNGGLWYKSTAGATTLTKSDYDPLTQSKTYTDTKVNTLSDALNPRIAEFPHRTGFVQNQVIGPIGPDLTTTANLPYSINNGELSIAPAGNSSFIRCFKTGQQRFSDCAVRVTTRLTMDAMTAGSYGNFIGFGDVAADFRGIWYTNAGALSVVNTSGTVVNSQSVTDSDVAFVAGEETQLEVEINSDGTGYAIATKLSTGAISRLEFSGIPLGSIWAVWRRSAAADTGKYLRFHIQQFQPVLPIDALTALNKAGAPFVSGFSVKNVDGLYAASTGEKSTQDWGVESGDLRLTLGLNGIYLAKVGMNRTGLGAVEYAAKATLISGSGGVLIAFGDNPATRVVCAYLNNGFVGTLNSSNSVTSGAVQSALAFTDGQAGNLQVFVRKNGTATITAISPDGTKSSLEVSGIPTGTVWVGQRNVGTIKVNSLTATATAEAMASLQENVAANDLTSLDWQTYTVLPDSVDARFPQGFTCTGLDRVVNGRFKGCWVVGDDGRLQEGDGSPFAPAIHILDPVCSRILVTIPANYSSASLQGVTCDTLVSSINATVWAACSTDGTIRNYRIPYLDSNVLQNPGEIVADRITMTDLGISGFNPNALVFDATRGTGRGALWVGNNSDGTVYCIDADPNASTRILHTITLANNPDQFQLIGQELLYQYGQNGVRANIRSYNLTTDIEKAKWGPLTDSLAPEGFYYDATSKTLYLVNDGGYHKSVSNLQLNVMFQYRVKYS